MGMFDWYRPEPPLSCPACGAPLSVWQGKDGPRLLLVWKQGQARAIGIGADDVDTMSPLEADASRLPGRFRFRSWDCEDHRPAEAEGEVEKGVWVRTRIVGFGPDTGRFRAAFPWSGGVRESEDGGDA